MKMKKVLAPVLGLSLLFPSMASAADNAPAVKTPAADLRAGLDHLLSEHFALSVIEMEKRYEGAQDADAAKKALDQNAADMKPAIASIYGADAAQQFNDIFAPHNDYTDDYVKAVKAKDMDAKKEAEMKIDRFAKDFGMFLGKATGGKLPEDAAVKAVQAHEDDVQKAFDSYAAGDYKQSNQAFRDGFHRMFDISKALSTAIVSQSPDKFENSKADTAAADLRSTLNSLTSEHFALAAMSMQKGVDGAKDYDFVNWAEDQHTADFTAAIKGIYGAEGASQFEKVWQGDHINAQGDLVSATLEKDENAMNEAKDRLTSQFATDFGNFLAAATENNLPTKDAMGAVKMHEDQVIQTFEQYVNDDYDMSYQTFREGFKFTFGIGETLGGAIVKQMPDKFAGQGMPDMPKTGMGGSEASTDTLVWVSIGALAAAGLSLILRKRLSRQQ
ncbi:copper amine oxidase [Fictibacillus fluitans]|uniref:Copper amine oxidase n=1 Tax=Fictibacillus fluitans TaxID=3058422 RepID=A0ABT8HUV3_9BACL|nr:copper amine oxidase [Fictibacillus sp. NE201]MDN4524529.1 copper amine oxidase [Fictibacillus sp. NE201]